MNALTVTKHRRSRFWAVRDGAGELVCLCVYKRGAVEVARRLTADVRSGTSCLRETLAGAGQHGFVGEPLDYPRGLTVESAHNGDGRPKTPRPKMKARIQSDRYQFNHGHAPRGHGSWAFHPDFNVDALNPGILWVNQSTFKPAAKKAAAHFGALGFHTVEVLP